MTNTIKLTLAFVLLTVGCSNPSDPGKQGLAGSTSQPVQTAAPAQRVDYGAEVSRFVYQNDEVVSVLRNGMTVIVKRVSSPVVSVRGYVRTGGVYEGRWLGGGLSHLLEHLVAGGSNGRRSEAENRNLLQQIGNNSNAYTTNDHTAYFVNTTAADMEKAVDLVSGWMLTAKITPEEYRREYEVVQRELEMGEGEPERVFYKLAMQNRYLLSPMRVPTIGYQEVIRGLSRDDVYAYYKLAYQPNNMVFVVTGNLDPEQMLQAVRKHVAEAPPGRVFEHNLPAEPPVLGPRTVAATFPKLGQAQLELGFPSIKLSDPDLYALDLLATILGQGESSILVEEIRDQQGLASAISASSYTPEFVEGTFSIDMMLDPAKIAQATAAVLEQIEKIKKEGVSEDRLGRAKVQTKTARAFGQQSSEEVASTLATDYLSTGEAHFSDRYVERMQRVTAEQVKAVANKYLDRSKLLTTALLPEEAVAGKGLPAAVDLLRPLGPTTRESPAEGKSQIARVELHDGTILLLKRVPTAPVVVMSMYSLGGLTAEDAKTNGLGNLAMQLVSRGTRTRSARQIAEFFDSIGGQFSATCGNNSWAWTATCLKEDVGRTLEVFGDLVHNATFPDAEVEMMRKRVLAGIEAQDADWLAQSMRFFRASYFGPVKSPYQFMAIGTKENVGGFKAQQAREWYTDQVLTGRRVLAIFGDIDVEKARALATSQFAGERSTRPEKGSAHGWAVQPPTTPKARPSVTVRKVLVNATTNPQAGVVIGFDSNTVVGDAAVFPLTVADTMTSGYGYPTGYIFETLRGQGLVYTAHGYLFPGYSRQNPGSFIVYAGCDPKNVNRVVEIILENMARLQGSARDLQVDWFERSKKLTITSDALENETPAAQATTAALDELFGLGYDYHARFADHIGRVRIPDVQGTAGRMLSQCVVTISTNAPEVVQVKEGERKYDSFPPVDLTPQGVQHDRAGQ
jgi:zinc protease